MAFLVLLVAIGILFTPISAFAASENDESIVTEDNGFLTDEYDVTVDLTENNVVHVTEDISVDFLESRHGIYRYIPYQGTVTRQVDGKIVQEYYQMDISNMQVPGYDFETYRENGYLVIKIGSPDYVLEGPMNYEISYQCTLYDDENAAFDSFYWNLIPNGWATVINHATIKIHMPKQFDQNRVEWISGAYGATDQDAVQWNVDGLEITGSTIAPLSVGEGITANIILPEGYFVMEKTMTWAYWLMMVFVTGAPLVSILLWFLFGRDPKVIKTVEFYPPDEMNSAEVGYIIDGVVDSKDVVSLIINWANKGYLEIVESNSKEYILKRLKDLEPDAKTYEYTMYHGLFGGKEAVALSELKGEFYGTFEAVKSQLRAHFTMNRENRIFTQSSLSARALGLLFMMIPMISVLYFCSILDRQHNGAIFLGAPAVLFSILGFILWIRGYDMKESLTNSSLILHRFGGLLLFSVGGIGIIAYGIYTIQSSLIGIIGVFSAGITLFLTTIMKKRTKKSAEQMGKLLGFKEFIRTAELDRIEQLVEENPSYFYHVLPYAYVFGLSSKWAKHFEALTLEPPTWYGSSYHHSAFNSMVFLHSFHHYTNMMQQNIIIPQVVSGNGADGGGFTSGGGFSGGGFSGGGGGSW